MLVLRRIHIVYRAAMTLFASPKSVLLLLMLIFAAQSSAFAHACLWSATQASMDAQTMHPQGNSLAETFEKPCHEVQESFFDANFSDAPVYPDSGDDCSCATGGCATAASMPVHSYAAVLLTRSSIYPPIHQTVLSPAQTNLLRPPSIA